MKNFQKVEEKKSEILGDQRVVIFSWRILIIGMSGKNSPFYNSVPHAKR